MSKYKLIIHWTAGGLTPNKLDLEHYHRTVDHRGNFRNGFNTFADNYNCYDGKYAAHAGGYNTNTFGYAFCGMAGFESKNNPGKNLLTKVQIEAGCSDIAKIIKEYGIPISNDYIMTHYELGQKSKTLVKQMPLLKSNIGKIDIIYLPPYSDVKQDEVGDFLRNKINWYSKKI